MGWTVSHIPLVRKGDFWVTSVGLPCINQLWRQKGVWRGNSEENRNFPFVIFSHYANLLAPTLSQGKRVDRDQSFRFGPSSQLGPLGWRALGPSFQCGQGKMFVAPQSSRGIRCLALYKMMPLPKGVSPVLREGDMATILPPQTRLFVRLDAFSCRYNNAGADTATSLT